MGVTRFPTSTERPLPLDPERQLMVCAFIALIDAALRDDDPQAPRQLYQALHETSLVRQTSTDSLWLLGILGAPAQSTPAILRNWIAAARDRLAGVVG